MKKGILAGLALSAALMMGMAVPAFAADIPSVGKTLEMNAGSTVTATFQYTATPIALSTGNGAEQTYTDGPAANIADITLTDATSTANNTGTGAITFGGAAGASAFTHAGVYAWKITENTGTYSGTGEMQYDPQVYTLIVTVANGASGLEFSSVVVAKGEATSVTNSDKVSGATIPFKNKYTEGTSGNTDLTITKKVAGNQADKTKKFDFTVTFKAPAVLPAGQDAAAVLNAINPVANGATDVVKATATGDTMTVTFKAADANAVTFENVLVGTTYTIAEAAADGYTQSYAAVANGESSTSQSNLLIGKNTNTGTMTNTYTDITPTGLVLNNLPFILMGLVAVAGLIVYGAAKRKLER